MNLTLDENQAQIKEAIQGFVRSEVTPHAEAWDASGCLEKVRMAALAELGMLGIMVGEAYDGVALGLVEAVLVLEQVARGEGGLAAAMASHAVVAAPLIERSASPSQVTHWLPRLSMGEALAAWAASESAAGLPTRAKSTGSGWSLSGAKRLVAGGTIADLFVVSAELEGEPALFLVPSEAAGVSVTSPGLLGLRAGGLADVTLTDVVVTEDARLEGGADTSALGMAMSRVALGAVATGLGARAIEAAAGYALERKQFGKPIADFQAIQNRLADAEMGVEAGRLLVQRAAATEGSDKAMGSAAAKAYLQAARAAFEAADHAIQIHGGYGYVREYQVERLWRDARTLSLMAGTPSVARDLVAQSVYERA